MTLKCNCFEKPFKCNCFEKPFLFTITIVWFCCSEYRLTHPDVWFNIRSGCVVKVRRDTKKGPCSSRI